MSKNLNIGERIKSLRLHLDKTTAVMGEELGTVQSSYSKIERGELRPSAEMLAEIVNRWGVSAEWLLTGKGEMFENGQKPQEQSAAKIDRVLFQAAITAMEEVLEEMQRKLPPKYKAKVIAALYEYMLANKIKEIDNKFIKTLMMQGQTAD